MKITNKNFFSLIELCLAIGVLAVGATAVTTMIPVGIKENRESIGNNYSSIFADDMHSYISNYALNLTPENWKAYFNNLMMPKNGFPSVVSSNNWTLLQGDIYSPSKEDYKNPGNYTSALPGVYGIKVHSGNSNTPDFVAQANIWVTEVQNLNLANSYGNAQQTSGGFVNVGGGSSQSTTPAESVTMYKVTSNNIGINPNNSTWVFELKKPDGSYFTRADMKENKKNDLYNNPGVTMEAILIKMRMKGGGPDITVDTSYSVDLKGKNIIFEAPSSDPMEVCIWKENGGMGQWYIRFEGGYSTIISTEDGSSLNLPDKESVANPLLSDPNANNSLTTGDLAKGVNVEISWPIEAPYANRTKLKYYFEVFNKDLIAP
ncbi:MAG TPA: hypothetical protein DD381_02280 [Lentisphaeria bacterium]|nr:MAG: hypothetical protein A2X47_08755 [Lentisphaerae bacterium GWF2_38_69]HBM15164.1 hypothetical protein [Lentisphaeria bacterium]